MSNPPSRFPRTTASHGGKNPIPSTFPVERNPRNGPPMITIRSRSARWATLAATAALALSACSGVSTAGEADEPQSGGRLTIALAAYPEEGLNPHVRGSIGPTQVLRNSFDSLVAADYDESFHPWLAESWERSDDGLTYTFTLREGVTFHDGEPFDAAAVKTNFDRVTQDEAYAAAVATSTFRALESTEVVDELTVRTVLSEPAADWLHTLSSLQGAIISPKSLAEPDVVEGGIGVAGTGPFVMTEVIEGSQLTFERNDDYDWAPENASHEGPAYLDELVVQYVPEPNVRAGLLTAGEVDAIGTIAPADVELFDGVDGFDYEWKGSNVAPTSLYFNTTSGPTQDVRVRAALRDGVDLDPIIESVFRGQNDRAWSIVQPNSALYVDAYEDAYGSDVDGANALLDEAGWTGRDDEEFRTNAEGERLTVRLLATDPQPPLSTVLEGYQAELRTNLGVEVELQFRDEGTVDIARENNEYEIFPRSVGGVDPGVILDKVYATDGPINGPKLADPQVDQWLAEGRNALDVETRRDVYDQIAQYALIDTVTTLPLYTDRYNVAARAGVHDITAFIDPPRGLINGWAYNTWVEQ